jgi:hypothetical protein
LDFCFVALVPENGAAVALLVVVDDPVAAERQFHSSGKVVFINVLGCQIFLDTIYQNGEKYTK